MTYVKIGHIMGNNSLFIINYVLAGMGLNLFKIPIVFGILFDILFIWRL